MTTRLQRLCLALASVCLAVSAADDIYCEFSPGETPSGWAGNKGQAQAAPRVTVTKDAAVGSTAVQAEALAEGQWQGISLDLPEPVDLTQIRAIAFHVRQTAYPGHDRCAANLTVRFADGGYMNRTFEAGGGQWQRVELPIDADSWETAKQVQLVIGKAAQLHWYPFRTLDKPGETLSIDGLTFLPKEAGDHPIPVQTYTHAAPPTRGDSGAVLTDGVVAKAQQAWWRQFADVPDIRFDLGAVYAVNDVVLEAVAVPSQNLSGFMLSTSLDGQTWRPAAAISNEDERTTDVRHSVRGTNLNIVGRHIRLQASRHRQDFPITIGEVTFLGHLASPQDVTSAARAHYTIGPDMPPVGPEHYWKLSDGTLAAWVHRHTGVVTQISFDDKLVVARMVNEYTWATKTDERNATGYGDRVETADLNDNSLVLTAVNPELPDVRITTRLRLRDGRIEQDTEVTHSGENKAFFALSRQVVLSQTWREGGVYETWGSGHDMKRMFAADVVVEVPADSGPVLTFENPAENVTLFHYRHRCGKRFARLGGGKVTVAGFGKQRTLFAANGWTLGDGMFLLGDDLPDQVETHLAFNRGSVIDAYERYLQLPDVKAFRETIRRPEWLNTLRTVAGSGWIGLWEGVSERVVQRLNNLLREGAILMMYSDTNHTWGEFPTEGTVMNLFGGVQTADDVKAKLDRTRALSPRFKVGLYTWLWSAFEFSQPYQEHPEWFVTRNRQGATVSFFPGVATNFCRMAGLQDSQDQMVEAILRNVDAYDQDYWYLDGGGSQSIVDWWNMRLDDLHGWDDLSIRIRNAMQNTDPDRVVFFNNPENPLADLGFLESHGGVLTRNWRQGAAWMWKFELWQRNDPLFSPLYIYWGHQTEGAFENYMVGLGLMPAYISRFIEPKDIPYVSAQQQTRFVSLVDAQVSPNWRYDPDTALEAIPVRHDGAGWVFLRSHADDQANYRVAAAAAPFGLTDPSRPIHQWLLRVRDARQWNGRVGEREAETVYRDTRWRLDRAVVPQFLSSTPWTERVQQDITCNPQEGILWMLTQSDALVYSVDALPLQLWLPEALGVKADGRTLQDRVVATVTNPRNEAEILLLLPDGRVPGEVTVNGDRRARSIVVAYGARAVVIKVPNGQSEVVCTLVPDSPPQTDLSVSAIPAKPGETLRVIVSAPADWRGQTVAVSMMLDRTMLWHHSVALDADSVTVPVPVPKAVRGGTYQVLASDLSGTRLATTSVTLSGGTSQVMLPNVLIHHAPEPHVEAVDSQEGPIPVLRQAWEVTEDTGRVAVHSAERSITVETPPMYQSHWNVTAAGLEVRLQRFARLRFEGTFKRFNHNTMLPGRHFVKYDNVNCFAGLTLDFGTPQGYSVRTAASLGKVYPTRSSTVPTHVGTGTKPDRVMALSDYILRLDESETVWVDLEALGAPAEWDGRVWITPTIQNVCPNRRLTVTLLDTQNALPAGATLKDPIDLVNTATEEKTLPVPQTEAEMKVDGHLQEEAWNQALTVQEFTLLGNPAGKATQDTVAHILRDDTHLYVAFVCSETEKDTIDTTHGAGGAPWRNDSVEIYLRVLGTDHDVLHIIVDPDGHTYRAIEDHHKPNGKRQTIQWPDSLAAARGKKAWTVEVKIPLARLGITQSNARQRIGFNLGRNRHAGATSHYTLVPGNRFAKTDHSFLLIE